MDSEDNSESSVRQQNTKNLMRNQYYDVMVKVDADVYHLNKLQLALKSEYFEKLLTEYSDQKECNLIQLPVMDTDTFSAIVDIIYDKELASVLNDNNYVTLLMAMDYLQMDIDLITYANFIEKNSTSDARIFTLYNFIRDNPNMQYLTERVLKYISEHFMDLRRNSNKELFSLSLDHFTIILREICSNAFLKAIFDEAHGFDIVRKMCQICAEWVHYDLQSRLPQAAQLLNAIKRALTTKRIQDANFYVHLPQITEHVTPEILAKLFRKCLVFNGEINPVRCELLREVNYKKKIHTGPTRNRREKMEKFMENHYFADIEVKVEEKIYKLHRFILNSASGYFNEISSKQSPQPIKINEYLLRSVDQITFDMIVKYIYFDELQLTFENITSLLTAGKILKMEKLYQECTSWIKKNIEEVCSRILIIDECIDKSSIAKNIEAICSEVLTEPVIGKELSIYSISFDTLEDLLESSSTTRNNPNTILEICSKWVMHDVKNRYHLIPQIALAINHNRMIDHDDYKMQDVDFNTLSEQLIRDKLWNILSSTTLIASASGTKILNKGTKRKLYEVPVFLAWTGDDKVHILNSNLDEIASFCFSSSITNQYLKLAATLLNDNLFIMLSEMSICRTFYVNNLPFRKFISLNSNNLTLADGDGSALQKYSLLNCRGQVYCCFKVGSVFKYSTELNRWMIVSSKPEFDDGIKKRVWFASDGNELYRMYQQFDIELEEYVVEGFDFQENVWLEKSSFTLELFSTRGPINLTITSGNKLTVIFASSFILFDQNTRSWSQVSLAENQDTRTRESIRKTPFALTQYEDKLLHVLGNKLYQKSDEDPSWQLKKELPLRSDLPSSSRSSVPNDVTPYPYKYVYITAIHGPVF
ncbi:uncharacterized protein LOC135837402 [Planococcus citri]|uniref:uncharacterized protein LOC135837402 n=1 Tax=Planococcus citri TaxID=170843 RepID=UPI0031F9401B